MFRVCVATFPRFPIALAYTDVVRTFYSACIAYESQLAKYKRASDPQTVAQLQEEFRLALQKWDYQNRESLKATETKYAPLSARIKDLSTKLSEEAATLAAKQVIQAKPRDVQLVELRNELEKKYEARKKSVLTNLAAAEAQLAEAKRARWKEIRDQLVVAGFVLLVIVGAILLYGYLTSCPSCKRIFAASVERNVETGREEEYRTENQVTQHYDLQGKKTGESQTPIRQRYIITYYDSHKVCRHCNYAWIEHKTRRQKT